MSTSLRSATERDGEAIAFLHWKGWEEAYRGLLADALLDATTLELRRSQWKDWLPRHLSASGLFIAESSGEPVGFALAIPARDIKSLGVAGEVQLCYVLQKAQRQGLGRDLMRACALWFSEKTPGRVGLWAVTGNAPARAFYERLGGIVEAERRESLRGAVIDEVAYVWPDADALRAGCA